MIDTLDKIIIANGFLKALIDLFVREDLFDNHGMPEIEGINGNRSGKKLSIFAEACIKHLNCFCELNCSTEAPTIQQIDHLIDESQKIIEAAGSFMPKTSTRREEKS
ncbi:MAG: hypothetical protein WCT16_00585 [Candidatus Buchananbacteria bacterium]